MPGEKGAEDSQSVALRSVLHKTLAVLFHPEEGLLLSETVQTAVQLMFAVFVFCSR